MLGSERLIVRCEMLGTLKIDCPLCTAGKTVFGLGELRSENVNLPHLTLYLIHGKVTVLYRVL